MITTTKQNWNRITIIYLIVSITQIIIDYENKIDGRIFFISFMLSYNVFTLFVIFAYFLLNNSIQSINISMDLFNNTSDVRRNETICCLIGFGIGVGCCIIYKLLSKLLNRKFTSNVKLSTSNKKNTIEHKQESIKDRKYENYDYLRHNNTNHNFYDDITWSEMSSSLSTVNLLQDSYHSNSLTGDSGVDCPEISSRDNQNYNDIDDDEILFKKYDLDTRIHHDTQTATESHVMSCISTEKGLERALEQTSRFYTDLEHIASDLGTLTKRYSQSQTSLTNRQIDALDWDWQDDFNSSIIQSPKNNRKHQQQQHLLRSNNRNKIRRKLNTNLNQTEYNESDNENRSFNYSTSPLRKKHSSVYFDSTDDTSGDENIGDETLQN